MPDYSSTRLSVMVCQLAETTRVVDTCYSRGSGLHGHDDHEHFMNVLSAKRNQVYEDLVNEAREGLNGEDTEKRRADMIALAKAHYAMYCELPSYQPELLQSGAFVTDSRDYLWDLVYGGEAGNDFAHIEEATQVYVQSIREQVRNYPS